MPPKASPMNFSRHLPKKPFSLGVKLQKALEVGGVDVALVMEAYFKPYWEAFKAFWEAGGEKITRETFALAPHNGVFLMQWVFHQHPEVMEQVESDMEEVGWL